MTSTRSFILAVLLLGALRAGAQTGAPTELTWYYQETTAAPHEYQVPQGYSVCSLGHTGAAPIDNDTFRLLGVPADGERMLSVAAAPTCPVGTPAQNVRLVILPVFSTVVGTLAAGPHYIELEGTGQGQRQFLLVFDGAPVMDPKGLSRWALLPSNFSARRVGWETSSIGGSVAYRFEGPVDELPTDLQARLTAAGAPPDAEVLNPTTGQALTAVSYSFNKWRFQESDLTSVFPVSDDSQRPVAATDPVPVTLTLPHPLQLLAQDATPLMKAASCPAATTKCEYPRAGGIAPLSFTLTRGDLVNKSVRLQFSLLPNRVYVGTAVQTQLTVNVQKDECTYEIIPLNSLLAGFRDTRLYLQLIGYRGGSVEPKCLDRKRWTQWSTHADGFQVKSAQALQPFGLLVEGEEALDGSSFPTDVVVLPISSVQAEAGGKATLRLTYADGGDVKLRRGGSPLQLAVSTPPVFAGPVRVEAREPHGRQGNSKWQDWEDIGTAGFKDLAVNRNNLLFFEAADLDAWRMRPASLHVQACKGATWQPGKDDRVLRGESGLFCLVPQRETDDGFAFQALYQPKATTVLTALPGLPSKARVDFGHLERTTNLRSKPLRTALNLQERASVRCENTRAGAAERSVVSLAPEYQPDAVIASAYSGPRAVPAEDLDHCKVVLSLRRNAFGEDSEDKGLLELKAEALELLQAVGEQSLTITADILPEQGKEKTNLFSKTLKLRNRDDLEVVNGTVEVPILLRKGGSIQLEDYSVVRVSVAHASADGYVVSDDSFPKSQMDADLRRMPDYLAGRIVRGVGPRAFFTIEIPTGLVRWPGAGYEATSSTSHRRLEAAVFGAGALAVLELYDFDNAKQFLSFNPQLHAGVLLSVVPRAGIPPPRLSLVTGLGVRFPSSIRLPAGIESGLASVFWVEWGRRARGEWEPAFLFGFSVNVGSFPN